MDDIWAGAKSLFCSFFFFLMFAPVLSVFGLGRIFLLVLVWARCALLPPSISLAALRPAAVLTGSSKLAPLFCLPCFVCPAQDPSISGQSLSCRQYPAEFPASHRYLVPAASKHAPDPAFFGLLLSTQPLRPRKPRDHLLQQTNTSSSALLLPCLASTVSVAVTFLLPSCPFQPRRCPSEQRCASLRLPEVSLCLERVCPP